MQSNTTGQGSDKLVKRVISPEYWTKEHHNVDTNVSKKHIKGKSMCTFVNGGNMDDMLYMELVSIHPFVNEQSNFSQQSPTSRGVP